MSRPVLTPRRLTSETSTWERSSQLITMPFRPFHHLIEIQDQLACLSCVHRHLEPGGLFALDVFNPKLTALISDVGQTERERRAPHF